MSPQQVSLCLERAPNRSKGCKSPSPPPSRSKGMSERCCTANICHEGATQYSSTCVTNPSYIKNSKARAPGTCDSQKEKSYHVECRCTILFVPVPPGPLFGVGMKKGQMPLQFFHMVPKNAGRRKRRGRGHYAPLSSFDLRQPISWE
jgi:hypothetical protein